MGRSALRNGGMRALATALCAGVLALGGAHRAHAADNRAEANKRVVAAFYEAGLNCKDYAAASRFFGPRYIQHNPMADDGKEGFAGFVARLRASYPQSHSTIRQAFAEGDFVILHVHETLHPGDRGNAIVDIFRLQDGRIVEHWDVKQPVPDHANNRNTMF